jgi:hypothetical protein
MAEERFESIWRFVTPTTRGVLVASYITATSGQKEGRRENSLLDLVFLFRSLWKEDHREATIRAFLSAQLEPRAILHRRRDTRRLYPVPSASDRYIRSCIMADQMYHRSPRKIDPHGRNTSYSRLFTRALSSRARTSRV